MKLKLRYSYKDENFNIDAFKLIAFSLYFAAATYGIKAIVIGLGLGSLQSVGSLLVYISWFLVLFRFVLRNLFYIRRLFVFELFYIGLLLINYYLFPDTQVFYQEYMMFIRQIIVVYIPAGAVFSLIDDYANWQYAMEKIAFWGSVFLLVAYFLGYVNVWEYQYLGVQISPFALILYSCYLGRKRVKDLLVLIIDVILIFMGGRQSIFVLLVGITLIYVYSNEINNSKKRLVVIACFLLCGISYFMSDLIIGTLSSLIESVGVSSRTLEMLASGELTSFASRDRIFQTSLEIAKNNGNVISGLFADRYYLRNTLAWAAYPHNLILEILIDFGMLWGTVLIILLVFSIIKKFIKKTGDKRSCLGMIIALTIVRLFVSSSFMIEGTFYLFIGLLLSKDIV